MVLRNLAGNGKRSVVWRGVSSWAIGNKEAIMIKFFINLFVLGSCTFVYSKWKDNTDLNFLSTLIGGFVLANFYQLFLEHKDYLGVLPKLIKIRIQSRSLRISFASLIRIKVGDKYFLIKSKRFNLWQPVGGVYKYFDSDLRRRFGLQDDNGGFKRSDPNELRLSFPSDKIFKALSLMKWFDSRLGREISPDREFREELLDPNILSKDLFKEVHFEFIERTFELRFSEKFQVWELMAFEVFDLKLEPSQIDQIKSIIGTNTNDVIAMTKNEIDRDGFASEGNDFRIGGQTKYIL